MKLIFCDICWDVFKLNTEIRSCKCGHCVGQYDADGHHAVTNGNGHALAIGNGSLTHAISNRTVHPALQSNLVPEHEHRKALILCWHRSHDGDDNPRSRIDLELQMPNKKPPPA